MKRCPQCNRVETDDALKFCRADGTPLVASAPLESESATISLSGSEPIELSTTGRLVDTPSIAVLPFVNMSADPENEFFCDGLAEELLNALTKIDDLKVAARTSSFSFKGKSVNVDEIGLALHVKTILEGSVRKSGNRLRITVQLVNASDGYHLWSERYDRELQDIFDVQDEITLSVLDALKLKLMGGEKAAILKRHTDNAEAYQLYLRGRFFFFKRTPEAMNKAIECFEEAIELDAEYALAFAGLADCRTFLGFYEINAPAEMVERIRADAYKALELDDTLAETHTSVAIFRSIYEWDFTGSQKEFQTAIKLNPKSSLAHHFSGAPLLALGLKDAAIEAIQRAIKLDPFMAIYNAAFGWWLYLSRRFDEAVEQSLKTIEIAPNHFFAHWVLGMTYGHNGRYEEAVTALQKAATLTRGNEHIKAEIGRLYAQNGHRDEALRLLDELKELAKERYVSPVNIAKIYVGLGERDRVFEYLEKALAERAVRLPWFFIDPALEGYRDDPRSQEIMRRVGLPR
jgi:TolB-like protein/Tfp pilus assembly protein PilF